MIDNARAQTTALPAPKLGRLPRHARRRATPARSRPSRWGGGWRAHVDGPPGSPSRLDGPGPGLLRRPRAAPPPGRDPPRVRGCRAGLAAGTADSLRLLARSRRAVQRGRARAFGRRWDGVGSPSRPSTRRRRPARASTPSISARGARRWSSSGSVPPASGLDAPAGSTTSAAVDRGATTPGSRPGSRHARFSRRISHDARPGPDSRSPGGGLAVWRRPPSPPHGRLRRASSRLRS